MHFINELSFTSFNDAWETYNTHYKNISLKKFLEATSQGEYKIYKIKDLINHPPDNLDINRLLAKSVNEAYPENNRPRGQNDLKSVKYHMRSKCVSPLFMIKLKNQEILMDGVHRLVAAKLSGKRNVLVYVVTL